MTTSDEDTKRIPRFATQADTTGDVDRPTTGAPGSSPPAGSTPSASESSASSASASSTTTASASQPALSKPKRQWWHRHLGSEERQRVMTELGIRRQEHWGYRFTIMLTLSVVVAVMGMSADSAAVVIGAMLLAPLMQPVLATAACISMALFRKSVHWILITLLATAWSILLSYLLAAFVMNGTLPREVTSRTAPDIRDLVVALCAGVAGAYATVRKDASSSLPGVAVAVALVPPLGAIGISLEAGNSTFTQGALLLYFTNLSAIVLAGTIVFVVTGFVPPRRLAMTASRTAMVGVGVAAIVIAIAIPLYRASTTAFERSDAQLRAGEIVDDWLGTVDTRSTPSITFTGDRIDVVVRSFEAPIDSEPLSEALRSEFGPDTRVSTEWEQVQRAETTTTLAPTTTVPSDEELLYERVEAVVDDWLASGDPSDPNVATRRRDALTIRGNEIRLDASGVGSAPPLSTLTERLDAELEQSFAVQLTWLERQPVSDDEPEETPEQTVLRRLDLFARSWAEPRSVVVTQVSFDGTTAIIELAGEVAPDATELVQRIEAEVLDPDDRLSVLFVERRDITTTTTTTTTTTVAPPSVTTTTAP